MHAAIGRPMRTRRAGLRGGDGGTGPAEGAREGVREGGGEGAGEGGGAASRSNFASCSLKRVSSSPARPISWWACASCSSARAICASWGSIAFGVGVEFIGVSRFRPMPSDGDGQRSLRVDQPPTLPPVLSKEWPYDGQIPRTGRLRLLRPRIMGTGAAHRSRTAATPHPYSITSSAVAKSTAGTTIPSVLAVPRLIDNWNLVGCSIGRLAGSAPSRIFFR
jgi:hypothetical protein